MPSLIKTLFTLLLTSTAILALPTPQLAGEGAAANSLLSGTDNAVGFGTENAEDKLAGNIATLTGNNVGSTLGGGSTSQPGPPPPPPPHRRQLDKVAKGAQAMANAGGVGSSTSTVTDALVNLDGTLTSGAANAGAQVADTEVQTFEGAGNSVPKI
jgi:hypothetical protein